MAYPIEVTFADPVEVQLAPYYRHFRQIPGIDVKTGRLTDLSRPLTATSEPPFDVLLLPLPNCHGVIPSAGYLKELFSYVFHAVPFARASQTPRAIARRLSIPTLAPYRPLLQLSDPF